MERNTPSIFCPVESSIQNVLQSLVSALDFNYNFVTSFSQSVTFLSYCWTLQRLLIRVGSSNLMTNSVTIHCYTRVLWMWYHLRYLPWLPLVKQIVTLTIDNFFILWLLILWVFAWSWIELAQLGCRKCLEVYVWLNI